MLRADIVFGWFASWHTFFPITLAWLLRTLVMADVVVTAFAPAGGALEETYMSLDTDRR